MDRSTSIVCVLLLMTFAVEAGRAQPCTPPIGRSWLYVADAGQEHDTLWFGFDSSATCGVDPNLCEFDFWWPCGDPPGPPLFCSYWFSWCPRGEAPLIWHDYRNFHSSAQVDTYQVGFGAGPSGYPMTLKWDKSIVQNMCDSAVMTDRYWGIINRVRMDLQDSLVLSAEQITSLYIIKYGAKQPVSDAGGNSLYAPRSFQLSQNYPNPFNPGTTISYQIPDYGWVSLSVYDVLGQEVKVIVNSKLDAGAHHVVFNAEGLPGGVYFYRLVTTNATITKRMLLIR